METQLENQILEFTLLSRETAVAECVQDLGCSVYAGGEELPAWASHQVGELLNIRLRDGAPMTTGHSTKYFILRADATDHFELLHGPMTALELVRHVTKATAASR
jgi:hypothetical protein